MAEKNVTIYGAGMSGLVAAINLAREGYAVRVHEREPAYGGSRIFNPSLHMTPLDVDETSNYLGIDISSAFLPLTELIAYFHDRPVGFPVKGIYAVERGDRQSSLDTILYNKCRELGVEFVWESRLDKKNLEHLSADTIIACGLDAASYRIMDLPCAIWEAWICYGPSDLNPLCWCWMDECITEYGYYTVANGMYFDMLFSNGKSVSKEALRKYQDFMYRIKGIEPRDNWRYVTGGAGVASVKQPRLFWKNAILAGTIAGCIDPFLGFGISGGLVSGKVAATAVTDRAKALAEFKRFTKLFPYMYLLKTYVWWTLIRPHVGMMERAMRLAGPKNVEKIANVFVNKRITPPIIPGYNVLGCN